MSETLRVRITEQLIVGKRHFGFDIAEETVRETIALVSEKRVCVRLSSGRQVKLRRFDDDGKELVEWRVDKGRDSCGRYILSIIRLLETPDTFQFA